MSKAFEELWQENQKLKEQLKRKETNLTIDYKIAYGWLDLYFDYFHNESPECTKEVKDTFKKMLEKSTGKKIRFKNKTK